MEEWKTIEYADYEVSSKGNVRRKGKTKNKKLSIDRGYYRVSISKDGISKPILVQKLVMDAFCPRPISDKKLVIRHLNSEKLDNTISNLRWATQQEVCNAAVKKGAAPDNSGGNNGMAKLKEADVRTIRKTYKKGDEIKLAEEYNVKVSTIMNVVNKKTWKNVA